MKLEDFSNRATDLLALADEVLKTSRESLPSAPSVDAGLFRQFRAAGLSFLLTTFGNQHPYYTEFHGVLVKDYATSVHKGKGVLLAAKDEIEGGWCHTARGLISAEIFSDLLEMASHLVENGYKDAAAVMIGSVLEEHLRNLCMKHGIETNAPDNDVVRPKKASVLNTDLSKAGVYGKLDNKNITAWLDLRNKAAHGEYGTYSDNQVKLMLQSVTDFMARTPL